MVSRCCLLFLVLHRPCFSFMPQTNRPYPVSGENGGACRILQPPQPTPTVLCVTATPTLNDVLPTLDELRTKSARDLKRELQNRRIPCNDLFEKEALVQRLHDALVSSSSSSSSSAFDTDSKPNGRSDYSSDADSEVVETPLHLMSMRGSVEVPNDDGLWFQPTDQPFATIDVQLQAPSQQTLRLMVDTACSGVVLKPETVARCGMELKSTPVTAVGASGTDETTGLVDLERFQVGDAVFGPLPASVQGIDSLPDSIDGIVGLSFLGQFATVEFDYAAQRLRLCQTQQAPPPPPQSERTVATAGRLTLLGSLGVYTADVYLGGRGPVKMIVDTGGSNTFLSWKGVQDLGLRRDSPSIARLGDQGAMGNTGQVFALTHRIHVSSHLQLLPGRPPNEPAAGLSLAGSARLAIDIGDIPLLQMLESQGVGGILGLDVFTRCAAIRLQLEGRERSLTLLM